MAFDEIKKNLSEVDDEVRSYVENSIAYYKLKSFKIFMRGVTTFAKVLLLAIIFLPTIIIISIAAAFGIGNLLDNIFYGFLIVAAFFIIVFFIVYLLRNKLDKPLLKIFSKYYFDEK